MATAGRIAALRQAIENAKANMGRRAASAVGDDIPRPRPVAETLPAEPGPYGMIFTPGGDAPDPARVVALTRKLATQGPESLDVLESLELLRAFESPTPPAIPLTPQQVAALQRRASQEGSLTFSPQEIEALRNAPGVADDADVPGDLSDTAAMPDDNLLASGVDINVSGLTPNTRRVPAAESVADRVWALTGPSAQESLSPVSVRKLAKDVAKYATVAEDGTVTYSPEFMQAIRFDRGGKERLDQLMALADDAARDPTRRAAEQVGEVADARQIAFTPRPDAPDRAPAAQDLRTARELLQETMPEGDWNAILAAYSKLDPEQRRAVLAAMPEDSGRFVQQMLDPNADDFSVSPNNVALALRPSPDNPIEDLLVQLDEAKREAARTGDDSAYNRILMGIQNNPADEETVSQARNAFIQRQQAADALRRSIIGNDPLYREQQMRVLESAVSQPPPRPAMPQGSRSIEASVADVPEQEMPTAFDSALAAAREAEEARQRRAPMGGMPMDARLLAAGVTDARDLPLFLKGRDGRGTPFESRSRGERAIEGNDIRALRPLIAARQKLNAAETAEERAAAMAEVAAAEAALERKYAGGRKAMPDSRLNKAGQQETFDDLVVSIVGARPKAARGLGRSSADMTAAERAAMQGEVLDEFGEDALDLLPDEPMLDMDELGEGGRRGRLGGGQQPSRVQGAMERLFASFNPLAMKNADGVPYFASAEAVADEVLSKQSIFKPGTANWDYAKEKLTNAINDRFAERVDTSEMAKARRATEVEEVKSAEPPQGSAAGDVAPGTDQDPDAVPQQQATWPEGTMRQTAGAPPTPSSPNAWDLPEPPSRRARDLSLPETPSVDDADVASFPQRGAAVDAEREFTGKPDSVAADMSEAKWDAAKQEWVVTKRRRRRAAAPSAEADDKLDASAVDLGDVSGDDVPAAAGKKGGKRGGKKAAKDGVAPVTGGDVDEAAVRQAISDEADRVYEETKRNYKDMGASDRTAGEYADAAREEYVRSQSSARLKGTTGDDVTAAPAAETPAPQATKRGGKKGGRGKKDTAPAADDTKPVTGDDVPARPVDGDEAKAADDAADGSTPQTPDTEGTPEIGPPPPKKKGWGRWPYVAGAVGGGAVLTGLARMGGGGGFGPIDIPPPPGGGGGGGGPGGGDFYPIPPGGSAGAMDEAAAQEAALQRALERIRGARSNPSGLGEPYQTLQNYSIWR